MSAGALRVHANWFNVDTGDIPLDDGENPEVLINNTKSDAQRLDEWIVANPDRVLPMPTTAVDQLSSAASCEAPAMTDEEPTQMSEGDGMEMTGRRVGGDVRGTP